MRANEFLSELFQPGKDWEWSFRGSEEAVAVFHVGAVPYMFHAYGSDGVWEVEFKRHGSKLDRSQKFGLTGTGNSAEVMSMVVDIMRAFLEKYKGKIETLRFSAKEGSRQGLYARMVKRLLPDWIMKQDGEEFILVAPNQMNEESKPAAKYNGLILKYAFNTSALIIKAFEPTTKNPLAYVKFAREDKELYPQDLWVNEEYRNRGIAKSMYDYLKGEGYIINRSHDQTKAGAGFWDKHRGEDQYVWEDIGNTTTLSKLYNGHYPDRDETFWDYVSSSELNTPLTIHTLQKHKVMIMLLSQYRAEHIDDIMDMLDDDRKELVQSYADDPSLSNKVIVLSGDRIIDGNHRALAAAIKGVPINYVDLADLDETDVN